MSTHVDSVTLAKRRGDNAVELQVFHVQVVTRSTSYRTKYICSLLFIFFGSGAVTRIGGSQARMRIFKVVCCKRRTHCHVYFLPEFTTCNS